jgi:threonine synthase
MKFISTRGQTEPASAFEAILHGLAPDGGLYVPQQFPKLDAQTLDPELSYRQIAHRVLAPFFDGDPLEHAVPGICDQAFDFPVELHMLEQEKAVLELFHGPTAAFKDFGARFLAGFMEAAYDITGKDTMILVATSGDTGGAVAAAFHKKHHIRVKVLFPKGRVSARQELQLTCWDTNIESYSVRGAFDDCQALVKQAFMDTSLRERHGLSSANSINLGRLLPQSVYYVYASLQFVKRTGKKPVFIIPSGNVGNAVGAHWALKMGAPIEKIVLAVNENRTIPDFLTTGSYDPRESIATIANAMDVGDPSNMERMRHLYPDIEQMRSHVSAYSVSDQQIRETIEETWNEYGYAMCPHTASGEFVRRRFLPEVPSIVVSTAHPAKFETIVEPVIGTTVSIPSSLKELLEKDHSHKEIDAQLNQLFD